MAQFQVNGTSEGLYYAGDTEYVGSWKDVDAAAYEQLRADIVAKGFTAAAENSIAGNLFITYYKGTDGLHLSYYPTKNLMKLATLTRSYEPVFTKPAVTETVTPSITQIGRDGATFTAPGMSYILQTSDGGFIIVDGGPGSVVAQLDGARLFNYLKKSTPAGQTTTIHAWIFTHPHGDHMQLACEFLEDYRKSIVLEAVIANFPDTTQLTDLVEQNELADFAYYPSQLRRLLAAYYPDAGVMKAHTGQRFWIADAEIEILYTHEDYYPAAVEWGNDTSMAFRVTLGGKKIVFLADCDPALNQFMADVYGTELKCDILQVAHHGFNGAVLDIYKYCNPDICFWPVDEERFTTDARCLGTQSGYEFNAWLRAESGSDGQRAREHYHASVTTTLQLK